MLSAVDLGCKNGNAMDMACKQFGYSPEACLAIDCKREYEQTIQHKGYHFLCCPVDGQTDLIEASTYLAFHFLEHVPSVDDARQIVENMMRASTNMVWIRIPNFSDDELRLVEFGLRFAWTKWTGHTAPVLVDDVLRAMKKSGVQHKVEISKLKPIMNTAHAEVVFEDAPIDTVFHDPANGPKQDGEFLPPLAGEFEIKARIL